MPTVTLNDIRNPKRKSGFDHVNDTGEFHGCTKRWRAEVYGGKLDKSGKSYRGPRRATPEEAAQDYCVHVNSGSGPAPVKLKTDAHPQRPKLPDHPKIAHGRRLVREGRKELGIGEDAAGYVYLMGEEGRNLYAKIGKSADDPAFRCGDGQAYNPDKLYIIAQKWVDDRHAAERALHAKYLKQNHRYEWFRLTPELISEFDR